MMIIAVTGWRGHTDGAFIRSQLTLWQGPYPLHIRVGDAHGADWFTLKWCEDNAVSHHVFRAHWEIGMAAGPQRNARMLQGDGDHVPGPTQLLLGFPRTDGARIEVPGSGTWGCLIMATQMGIRVQIPPYKKSGD